MWYIRKLNPQPRLLRSEGLPHESEARIHTGDFSETLLKRDPKRRLPIPVPRWCYRQRAHVLYGTFPKSGNTQDH